MRPIYIYLPRSYKIQYKYTKYNKLFPIRAHSLLPSSQTKFSLAPESQPDVLDDPDGGAPGLVGGQPHIVALHVQAPHEEAVDLGIAAAVTPQGVHLERL